MQSGLRWQRAHSPLALPGLFQPYAPAPVALWVRQHLGILQALRAVFWSVACGHVSCVCPAHPLGLATLRVALALRGLPVRPQGAPSEPRGDTPPVGGGLHLAGVLVWANSLTSTLTFSPKKKGLLSLS